tara:strand:- start:113 stop:355 length:243 start_codon:yes stop_codon:yes gene_type:complete
MATKLTKAQLIDKLQEVEETKYDLLKTETGMPFNTDEEWVDYIKRLQELNAERLTDCQNLLELLRVEKQTFSNWINNSVK